MQISNVNSIKYIVSNPHLPKGEIHIKRKCSAAERNRVFPKKLGFFAQFLKVSKWEERESGRTRRLEKRK